MEEVALFSYLETCLLYDFDPRDKVGLCTGGS